MHETETIFALSSAPGKAGLSVIRVSGQAALESLKALIYKDKIKGPPHMGLYTLKAPHFDIMNNVPRGTSSTEHVYKNGEEIIDQALVLTFEAPRSFTGENVVEYHCHGSPAIVKRLLDVLGGLDGHRLALPGEFTRRAFENGKMDLTEAEAVADLIDAETELQRLQALDQMGGSLSALYTGWADDLTKALAYIEAVIDFPDEDVPDDQIQEMRPSLARVAAAIETHLRDNRRGERLRDGIQVAVIGAPNAGKSSLVNALAQRDVAIVSDMQGTTRDVLEVQLDIAGYPVILSDTAGLRPDQLSLKNAQDRIESEGIRRALDRAQIADLKILMFDSTMPDMDPHTKDLIDEKSIIVLNKIDCHPEPPFKPGAGSDQGILRSLHAALKDLGRDDIIELSVSTGTGLDAFLAVLAEHLEKAFYVPRGTPSLTRQRHRTALVSSLNYLQTSLKGLDEGALPELIAEDVRLAVRALGGITGRVDVEDLLDVIFKDFCIGK